MSQWTVKNDLKKRTVPKKQPPTVGKKTVATRQQRRNVFKKQPRRQVYQKPPRTVSHGHGEFERPPFIAYFNRIDNKGTL